jgi:hypothetical protein
VQAGARLLATDAVPVTVEVVDVGTHDCNRASNIIRTVAAATGAIDIGRDRHALGAIVRVAALRCGAAGRKAQDQGRDQKTVHRFGSKSLDDQNAINYLLRSVNGAFKARLMGVAVASNPSVYAERTAWL